MNDKVFVILIEHPLSDRLVRTLKKPSGFGSLMDNALRSYCPVWFSKDPYTHVIVSSTQFPELNVYYLKHLVKYLDRHRIHYRLLEQTPVSLKPLIEIDGLTQVVVSKDLEYTRLNSNPMYLHLSLLGHAKTLTLDTFFILGSYSSVSATLTFLKEHKGKTVTYTYLKQLDVVLLTRYKGVLIDLVQLKPITKASTEWFNIELNLFDVMYQDIVTIPIGEYTYPETILQPEDLYAAPLINHLDFISVLYY